MFRNKTKKRLWSQQEALLDEESVGSRFFFLILVLNRGMGGGSRKIILYNRRRGIDLVLKTHIKEMIKWLYDSRKVDEEGIPRGVAIHSIAGPCGICCRHLQQEKGKEKYDLQFVFWDQRFMNN